MAFRARQPRGWMRCEVGGHDAANAVVDQQIISGEVTRGLFDRVRSRRVKFGLIEATSIRRSYIVKSARSGWQLSTLARVGDLRIMQSKPERSALTGWSDRIRVSLFLALRLS